MRHVLNWVSLHLANNPISLKKKKVLGNNGDNLLR
jgi:hypothetical protein